MSQSDLSGVLYQRLHLSGEQKVKVDPLISAHFRRLTEIANDTTLRRPERRSRILASWKQLQSDLAPSLNPDQIAALSSFVNEIEARGGPITFRKIVPLLAVEYGTYLPSDSSARAIFGDHSSSFNVGLRDFFPSPSRRYIAGFALGSLNLVNANNKLFVFSPRFTAEYRIPIVGPLSSFAGISAGPAYMDYSYDTPGGEHFGAKRLGAEGELEVGFRYGRIQLAADYKTMTRPSNLSFDGLEVSLTWIAVRF